MTSKEDKPRLSRDTDFAPEQVKISKLSPDFKDDLNFIKDAIRTLEKEKTKALAKKEMSYSSAVSLEKVANLYYKHKDCAEIIGDELVHENAVSVLLEYMQILTNGGKDYPLKNSYQQNYNYDCYDVIRSLLWNFTDASSSFCIEVGKKGFFAILIQDLKRFQQTFNIDKKRSFIVRSAISILHNCAALSENTMFLRETDAVPIVLWYAKYAGKEVEDCLAISSILLLSYIVDESNNSITLVDETIIKTLLELLTGAMESDDKRFKGYKTTELLLGLSRLANNKANSIAVIKNGILEKLVKLLEYGNKPEQLVATKAVWVLAFCDENTSAIRSTSGLIEKMKEIVKSSEDEKQQRAAKGALWVLEKLNQTKDALVLEQESTILQTAKKSQVMISYNWGSQEIIVKHEVNQLCVSNSSTNEEWGNLHNMPTSHQIKKRLDAKGYKTWLDLDHLSGSILQSMAEAVENSAVILICLSQKYKDSVSCRTEGEYAYKRRVPIVPILVEKGYKPNGWLGALVGTIKYFNCSSDQDIEENFPDLVKEIETKMKEKKLF